MSRLSFDTRSMDAELHALVIQAFELRDTPYLTEACRAIEDWYFRIPLAELERRQERDALLIRLLRETDPARTRLQAAA